MRSRIIFAETILLVALVQFLLQACSPPAVVNRAPVAFAGYDISVRLGEEVQLDGSRSYDPDGNALNYHWWLQDPDGLFSELGEQAYLRFTPEKLGIYVLSLVVNDGDKASPADLLSVEVFSAAARSELRANAGAGIVATAPGSAYFLNGSAEGGASHELRYHWSIVDIPEDAVDGANFSLSNADGQSAEFHYYSPTDSAVHTLDSGVFVFSLRVSDAQTLSEPDFVSLSIGLERSEAIAAELGGAEHYSLDADGNVNFEIVSELSNGSVFADTPVQWMLVNGPQAAADSDIVCPQPGADLARFFSANLDTSGVVPLARLQVASSCSGVWTIMACPQGILDSCPQSPDGYDATTASCCIGLPDEIEIHIEEFSP